MPIAWRRPGRVSARKSPKVSEADGVQLKVWGQRARRFPEVRAGCRTAAQAMTFKLIESVQAHLRAVNASHLVALVRAGAGFQRGVLLERAERSA